MSSQASPSDNVRRLAAFAHKTMSDRGVACSRQELEVSLLELTPAQLKSVLVAVEAVARGSDQQEHLALLSALRTASAAGTREVLREAGAVFRAHVLFTLTTGSGTSAEFSRNVGLLRRADAPEEDRAQARAALIAQCGSLTHDDLLPPTSFASGTAPGASRAGTPASATALRPVAISAGAVVWTWSAVPFKGTPSATLAQMTVSIHRAAADADASTSGPGRPTFVCAPRELPRLLAALLGWVDAAELACAADTSRTTLAIQGGGDTVELQLRRADDARKAPLDNADCYALAMLVLQTMVVNEPMADAQSVLAVCRDVMRGHAGADRALPRA